MNYIIMFLVMGICFMLVADEPAEAASGEDASGETAQDEAVMQAHRFFAADYFNKCWDLIDKPDRTAEDDLQMIHRAHASRAHWQAVGTADNFAVGEWQISHVYAILDRGEDARYHGLACLNLCKDNNISGFNLGFAYEALARAEKILGNVELMQEYIELGKAEAEKVEKEEDKKYLLDELESIR